MVNGGDLCLLNNVFPGFHISGVCSDLTEFCTEFESFSQDTYGKYLGVLHLFIVDIQYIMPKLP